MHHCFNVVTTRGARVSAVLVRALEPVDGLAAMRRRRRVSERERLARGPGCVAQALGLTLADNGVDLTAGHVWISAAPPERTGFAIARGPRIGISVARERLWRFYLRGHPCVSAAGSGTSAPGRRGPAVRARRRPGAASRAVFAPVRG
jgi:DNA-3-methyladenine glycosylase